jgi:hypothetical protein
VQFSLSLAFKKKETKTGNASIPGYIRASPSLSPYNSALQQFDFGVLPLIFLTPLSLTDKTALHELTTSSATLSLLH